MAALLHVTLGVSALSVFTFLFLRWSFTRPHLDLSGPFSSHLFWGNLLEVYDDKLTDIYTKWSHSFGGMYRLWGPFGVCSNSVVDRIYG
jgi:hypothetical protein